MVLDSVGIDTSAGTVQTHLGDVTAPDGITKGFKIA